MESAATEENKRGTVFDRTISGRDGRAAVKVIIFK
jgi:hypothetical protein